MLSSFKPVQLIYFEFNKINKVDSENIVIHR